MSISNVDCEILGKNQKYTNYQTTYSVFQEI